MKPVIICADDEEILLVSLKDQLKARFADQYSIETATNGDEALEIFTELLSNNIDVPLVISDQIMPGIKGNELLREIHLISPKTLKILLTGQADANAVGDAVNRAGLYRYIPKPWDEGDLMLTVTEAMRSFYLDKKLEEQNLILKEMNENLEHLVEARTAEVVRQKEEIQLHLESIELQAKDLEKRNDFIRRIFGRYVTDDVMMTLLDEPDALRFGGENRELTILMSDLRGFTALSERVPPEQVVKILNHYLGKMVDTIVQYNGTIIEILGDGIFIVFGAPRLLPNHADCAVACALAMERAMNEVNELLTEFNLPPLEMGIGINTGVVVVGNIGSDRRAKYGVVGNAVNLASRIESFSTGQQILISEHTKDLCISELRMACDFKVSVKGVAAPMAVYDVVGMRGLFDIDFAATHEKLHELETPLAAYVSMLTEKTIDGKEFHATVYKACRSFLVMRTESSLNLFDNVRLAFETETGPSTFHLYAKVTDVTDGSVKLSITSLTPEARTFIDQTVSERAKVAADT